MIHAFNPRNWEVEAGGARSTEPVLGQPGVDRETLSPKMKNK